MIGTVDVETRQLPVRIDRVFYLFRYIASHHSMLIRSYMLGGYENRIDIAFFGVSAIKMSQKMSFLEVRHPGRRRLSDSRA